MMSLLIARFPTKTFFRSMSLVAILLVAAKPAECRADDAPDGPRQIFICSSSQASPSLRKTIDDFTAKADQVPLLKAMLNQREANSILGQVSEELMPDKAYLTAAHNHLVVIGLQSQDPLLVKVWGHEATIDEATKNVYSEGWGYMQGDIGWIESDRNPFLHSRKIKAAPEDTILVKISGTSEAGVSAALKAFEGGLLNGFVVVGPLTRPKTTLLDLDPLETSSPGQPPAQVTIGDGPAGLVGWNQIPEQEYRAVLESGGVEPKKMWRWKYLAPGIFEQSGIVRWLGGLNRMAYGNSVDVIECSSTEEASSAAVKLSALKQGDNAFQSVSVPGAQLAWSSPLAKDEVATDSPGNVIVTSSGPFLFLSSLPPEGTSAFIAGVVGAGTP